MIQILRAPIALLALSFALPALSQSLAGPRAALVVLPAVAGARAEVPANQQVVFRNDASQTTRVVFHRRDVNRVDCEMSGGVHRTRPGQFAVQPGSELLCNLEAGSYRYETLTPINGAIKRSRARVVAE
ncbi:MAG: hypothetical protein JRH01_15235 [Deltaproteobacteria bacterium]|nr:hypothetical protein [Deltaproteobacteria bacterium]MBW2392856.1 hypothetical protein [Deltaproteobacteria bacterium]